MDMRATCREKNPIDGDGAEGSKAIVSDYDRRTGDGKWLQNTLTILAEAIQQTEAVSTAEPQKSMRSSDASDQSMERTSRSCAR